MKREDVGCTNDEQRAILTPHLVPAEPCIGQWLVHDANVTLAALGELGLVTEEQVARATEHINNNSRREILERNWVE